MQIGIFSLNLGYKLGLVSISGIMLMLVYALPHIESGIFDSSYAALGARGPEGILKTRQKINFRNTKTRERLPRGDSKWKLT